MRHASFRSLDRAVPTVLLAVLPIAFGLSACAPRDTQAEPAPAGNPSASAAPPAQGPAVTGGATVLAAGGIRAFRFGGKTERVRVSYVPVEGLPFREALRAEIHEASGHPWDVQLTAKLAAPVQAGDALLCTFWMRTERSPLDGAEGQTEFVFELAGEPWSKSISYPVRAGREWKQFFVRFASIAGYAPGGAQMIFRLGYSPETIEIGGVLVENFGKTRRVSDLPTTKRTYPGMAADAPWRREAAARIESLRKTDLSVLVKDKAGRPVTGAAVSVKMTRQAFGFGSAVVGQTLLNGTTPRYNELVPELFNMAVLENNLKWPPLAGDWGRGWTLDVAQGAVEWLRRRGLTTRGHVLVWPAYKNMPRSLRGLETDPERMRASVRHHVRELATQMRGRLVHWDVVNEPFDNHDLMDLLGQDVMVEWFREARAADPGVKLFINDYAILSGGGGETAHRDHYEKTIRFLIEKGAPLDGIGMQGHFGGALTSPEDMLKILDRFAKFEKPIFVTEYDLDIDDEELAGRFTRDFYTTLFSHPAVGGILMWGFWDGSHWRKRAPLYRQDWSLKPAGEAYRDLVLKQWRTNESGKTDGSGVFRLRAFLGSYEVTVAAGGRTTTRSFELSPNAQPVVVVFE